MVAVGATASTVHATVAGDGSVPPNPTARTANVWAPSASVSAFGDVHAANAPPSIEHSNVAALSGELNVKLTLAAVVDASAGPAMIAVCGAVVLTFQPYV